MKLAEKNILGKALDTSQAGYKVGRGGSKSVGQMAKTYKDAGGGKTTIGQVSDIGTRIGQKITGNTVTIKGKIKGVDKFLSIAKNDLKAYTDKGWKVVLKDAIFIMHPQKPK